MVKITKIKKVGGGIENYLVLVNGGGEVKLLGATVLKFFLSTNLVLQDYEWENVLTYDQQERCRASAWRSLERRPHSKKELTRKLMRKGYPEDITLNIVRQLEERAFLNEKEYAHYHIQHRLRTKHGRKQIQFELQREGIAEEIIKNKLDELTNSDQQEESARALLEKWNRRKKPLDPVKRRRNAFAYLIRRGFDSDLARKLVEEIIVATENTVLEND